MTRAPEIAKKKVPRISRGYRTVVMTEN